MDKPLAQEEIDALFAAARTRGSSVKEQPANAAFQPFTFSRVGQINREQMRAISLLNDNFARNLTHNLGAFLRCHFQVALASAEQLPYSEFIERIPEICYVASVRLEPLGAVCGLELDLALALPMIDLLLGGEGRAAAVRELTDIEESILGQRGRSELPRIDFRLAAGRVDVQFRKTATADADCSPDVSHRKNAFHQF